MLDTDRLSLRPWRLEDCEEFRPIATDPQVMRYIHGGKPWSEEQITEFVTRQMTGLESNGFCMWRLLLKQHPERLIGFCGLQPWRDRPGLEIGCGGVIEIGWWLARDCWGQGFATEAARAVLQYGFGRSGLEKLIAVTHRDNQASQRVARRIGLEFECAVPLDALEIWVFSASSEASPAPR